ncbi:histidine kinase [Sinomicrobium kalidii]|uniref:sensor histidine kinase n=1 Tax=Sinomicrobium kalidii TaxID=2900738 RepID=UPI001E65615C|nr:histidine kinase [Sinomicrobium kalidii]UGU14293.1 histidine kinase [Sinomicrobium kalidii]
MMFRKAKSIMGFDDRWMLIVGIPLVSFIIVGLIFGDALAEKGIGSLVYYYPSALIYTTIFWVVFRFLMLQCMKRWPEQEQTTRRVVIQVILVLVVYVAVKWMLKHTLSPFISNLTNVQKPHTFKEPMIALLMIFLITTVYEAIRFYSLLQRSRIEKTQLAKDNMQSQLEGLKNQVNPHFLFNSLNTLAHLIPEDVGRAEAFVKKLSEVYRYILEIKDEPLILLEDELEFLQSYIHLIKERFGDNFRVEISVDDAYRKYHIVPLSLQILFENAIKHNEISTRHPLEIKVGVDEAGQLFVRNNLQRKKQEEASTKIGLQNIRNRYRIITGKPVDVMVSTTSFVVFLPLVEVAPAK